MKNTFGTSVTVTLFGESHGPEIGAVIDGLAPGLPVDEAFMNAISYIHESYHKKITIDELAFLFKTNRVTLCKEFKKATGKTVVELINEKKFDKAKQKIRSTEDTFTKIAEDLNFDSIHYFTRFFKKMAGCTPKDFRKSCAENDN